MLLRPSRWPPSRALNSGLPTRRSVHSTLGRLDQQQQDGNRPTAAEAEKPLDPSQQSQPSLESTHDSLPAHQTLGAPRTTPLPIHPQPASARSPSQAGGFQRGRGGYFTPPSVRPGPWHGNNNFAPPLANPAHAPPTHAAPPPFVPGNSYWQPQQSAPQFPPGPAYNAQIYPRYPAFHQQPPMSTPPAFSPNQAPLARPPNYFAGPNPPMQHRAPFPPSGPAQDNRPGYFPSQYPTLSYPAQQMYSPASTPNQTPPVPRPGFSAPAAARSPVDSADQSTHSPLAARQRRTSQSVASFEFDFQDLSGADVLDRFAQNASPRGPSEKANQPGPMPPMASAYRQMPSYGPSGQFAGPAFNGPQVQGPGWGNGGYGPSMHAQMSGNPNQVPGRPNWPASRGRPMAARGSRAGPSRGKGLAPRGPRGRGRGMLFASRAEPSLPPPPKSVLDENGAFGAEPVALGSPQSTARSRPASSAARGLADPAEASGSDYEAIEGLICNSTTPVTLPGVAKPLQFSPLDRALLDAKRPETSCVRGEADRTETVRRTMELVSRNPSLRIGEKRQAVAVVEFLLMSREERISKMQ